MSESLRFCKRQNQPVYIYNGRTRASFTSQGPSIRCCLYSKKKQRKGRTKTQET
uniref:Uncharacterized protein n=1 Tax=Arundo donax TaxID=35708 RepID=A0A0A9G9B9_ARUDO